MTGDEYLDADEMAAVVEEARRPWHMDGYGVDGRATGVVDWYDGWHFGCKADSFDEMRVPRRICDPVQWVAGWRAAWNNGLSRRWRDEQRVKVES